MTESRLNIIVIAGHNLWGVSDRPERAPGETMKYFVSQGAAITMITCDANNQRYSKLGVNVILAGSRMRAFSKRRAWAILFSMFLFPIACTLSYFLNRHRIQPPRVIYAYETISVMAGIFLSRILNISLVNRFQGTVIAGLIHLPKWSVQRLKRCDHFFALSAFANLVVMTNDGTSGDKVIRHLNPKQHFLFLRNGFYVEHDEKMDPAFELRERFKIGRETTFMTLSRLVSWKRVDRAIQAFGELHKTNPDIRLVIVGDGDARKNLEEMVENMKLNMKIHFVGMVPHNQVHHVISQCQVFLSLFDLSNLGNPLFEAMLKARPIVTLNNGETASVIQNGVNGFFASSPDSKSISETMRWVVEHPENALRVGLEAQKWARENLVSWDRRLSIEFEEIQNSIKRN